MAEITKEELKEDLEKVEMIQDENGQDVFNTLAQLLDLPEEEFAILSPGFAQAFQQSVNNPNDKIALTQAFNALGYKGEDLVESFSSITTEVDKMNISAIKRDFLKQIFGTLANAVSDTEGISKRTVQIPIELCHEDAKIPQYAHISDSGVDLYALEDITVHPGQTVLVPTGIKVALPPGYELQVRPKSGRALKTKLRVANTPGTIDQGYRDEIKVIIENVDPPIRAIHFGRPIYDASGNTIGYDKDYFGEGSVEYGSDFFIGKGEKFAQLVLMEVPKAAFYRVEKVQDIGEDRGGGFGSTGLK